MGLTPEQHRIEVARKKVQQAQAALEEANEELTKALKPYPKEPGEGCILKFAMQHDIGGTTYKYAALRVGRRWYTTGSSCPGGGYAWKELVDFIRSGWSHTTNPLVISSHALSGDVYARDVFIGN